METFNFDAQPEPEKALISRMQPGQKITEFFILRKKEIRTKKESSDLYLSVELGDASGRISGSLWEDVQTTADQIHEGKPVKVKATVIDFRGKLHLNIDKIRSVTSKEKIDIDRFMPQSPKNTDELYTEFLYKIQKMKNQYLQKLLLSFFDDSKFKKQFKKAPGGKLWHHAYIGGLVEHTHNVSYIADTIAKLYPEIKSDLLTAAALLHDVGKIYEYDTTGVIDFSDEGRLHGHIVIGHNLVADQIKTIKGFPKKLRDELLHLILSHQGSRENGSPVPPMTLEAMILYYADELDSKANALQHIIQKEKGSETGWSSYITLLERFIYIGKEDLPS